MDVDGSEMATLPGAPDSETMPGASKSPPKEPQQQQPQSSPQVTTGTLLSLNSPSIEKTPEKADWPGSQEVLQSIGDVTMSTGKEAEKRKFDESVDESQDDSMASKKKRMERFATG